MVVIDRQNALFSSGETSYWSNATATKPLWCISVQKLTSQRGKALLSLHILAEILIKSLKSGHIQ